MKKDTDMTGIRMFMGLLIVFFATSVYADCYTVFGLIQLKPNDELCSSELYPVYPLPSDEEEQYIGQCFRVISIGNAVFKGVAGLTFLSAPDAFGEIASTPIFLGGEREGLSYFTARGYLTGRIWTRDGLLRGSIKIIDTGTINQEDGVVAEIIRIQGGEGDFEDATGRLLVYGPEMAPGWATYRGKICIDD